MTRIVALIATTFWIGMAFGQSGGEIRGTVLDENGQPVASAKVGYENLDDHRLRSGLVPMVKTDAEGNFAFTNLDWGRHAIYPEKEEDGYPNLRFAIYSGGASQIATVSADHPIASINAKLGPKAAVLHGTIVRVTDGTPISGGVELSSADHPERFYSTSVPPNYRILIPADTDVTVAFTASGHKSYSIPVHMKSGQQSAMDVKLTPEVQ